MKALVLGATGFLGSNLVRTLLAHGQQVRVLVRPTSSTRTLDGLNVERVLGDLRDPDSLAHACAVVQVIYQTAIRDAIQWFRVNGYLPSTERSYPSR